MVEDIILDTRAARILVHEDLVPPCTLQHGEVKIRCAHGTNITYPLASIKVSVGGENLSVRAAVSKTLPASVLLGRDVPELMSLLGSNAAPDAPSLALAATTRAQRRRQNLEEIQTQQREQASGVVPSSIDDNEKETDTQSGTIFDFDATLFPEPREKPILTRS